MTWGHKKTQCGTQRGKMSDTLWDIMKHNVGMSCETVIQDLKRPCGLEFEDSNQNFYMAPCQVEMTS